MAGNLINESVCFLTGADKPKVLVKLLRGQAAKRAIVFTRTKRGADRVARQLDRSGIRAEAIHSNKTQGTRQRILASFKSSRPPVLVATDLAARGIDVEGVSHVFNYDLPNEPEAYVHRIGRTGRAGASGTAIAFCTAEERPLLRAIEILTCRRLIVDEAHPFNAVTEASGRGSSYANRRSNARREPYSSGQQESLPVASRATVDGHDSGRLLVGGRDGRTSKQKRRRRKKALQRTLTAQMQGAGS